MVGLDKKKFHLLGTSMGGEIVGLYAAEYPEQLLSLTMVCPLGISFGKQQAMIDDALETDTFILLPQTKDELKVMFDRVLCKPPKIPGIFLSGILQLRLERHDYYKKRKFL